MWDPHVSLKKKNPQVSRPWQAATAAHCCAREADAQRAAASAGLRAAGALDRDDLALDRDDLDTLDRAGAVHGVEQLPATVLDEHTGGRDEKPMHKSC